MLYINHENKLGKVKADLQVIEEFISLSETLKEIIQEFDGKVLNKRFLTALKNKGLTGFMLRGSNLLYYPTNRSYQSQNTCYSDIEPLFAMTTGDQERLIAQETITTLNSLLKHYESKQEKLLQVDEEFLQNIENDYKKLYQQVEEFNKKYNDFGLDTYTRLKNYN